jgi:hypothetical protein
LSVRTEDVRAEWVELVGGDVPGSVPGDVTLGDTSIALGAVRSASNDAGDRVLSMDQL